MQSEKLIYKKDPCQPSHCDFPQNKFENIVTLRRFNPAWFGVYRTWLEYNIAKYAVFCCIVTSSNQKGVLIRLRVMGFQIGKKKERFNLHIRKSNSSHNAAQIKYESLMNEKQSIMTLLSRADNKELK